MVEVYLHGFKIIFLLIESVKPRLFGWFMCSIPTESIICSTYSHGSTN